MGSDGHQLGIEGLDLGCGLRRVGVYIRVYIYMGKNVILKPKRYIVAGIF